MNKILDDINDELVGINKFIYDNPELGNEEYLACEAHINLLEKYDFEIVEQFLGIETAFKATYDSKKPGPTIAVMAEYDALPGIGHVCGHNWIGTVASGVGIVLRKHLDEVGGKVVVLGTPAEETNGAKVDMADQGVFDDIDIALMAHPSDATYVSIESLALEAIEFEFTGKAAHAAASPEKGINALDAVITTFNSINALREHVVSSTRIHGIITEGGVAANIVPEKAVAQFYVRATKKSYLKEVVEKVKNCARGAALSTGSELSIRNYEKSYDNFVSNHKLNGILEKNFELFGIVDILTDRSSMGSLDAGNVSHVCPTVHPLIAITKEQTTSHTRALADATLEPFALKQMRKTISALSQTGLDIINNPNVLKEIKTEFKMRCK
jgi:amidohydrolase